VAGFEPPGWCGTYQPRLGCSFVQRDRCDLLCLDLERAEAIRRNRPDNTKITRAAARARALADPTRLRLVSALAEADELCVCDLAWIAEESQNLVSHHLRALRLAGFVTPRRQGKMILYSLTDGARSLLTALTVAGVELAR
jgi:DNA-binding transcriptional ArsR family regulator